MSAVIDFDIAKVSPYLLRAITGFLRDPPDSDFQRGYLAACITIYDEGTGRGKNDSRIKAAKELLRISGPTIHTQEGR